MPNPRLIYDFGMHKGEDTEYYLKKGFEVVSFEANPELAAHCRERFAAEIAAGRLTIVEGAVAPAAAGPRLAFYRSSNSVWGTIEPGWDRRNEGLGATSERIEVDRVDVADALRAHGVPFYMKIDIEGADLLVLEALREFPDRPRYLSIEAEKAQFGRLVEQLEALRGLGYTRFKAVRQGTIPGSRVRVPALDGRPLDHVFPADASGAFGEDLPGPWLDHRRILWRYRLIFLSYRLYDGMSFFGRFKGGWRVRDALRRRLWRNGLPDWYDTHARHDGRQEGKPRP